MHTCHCSASSVVNYQSKPYWQLLLSNRSHALPALVYSWKAFLTDSIKVDYRVAVLSTAYLFMSSIHHHLIILPEPSDIDIDIGIVDAWDLIKIFRLFEWNIQYYVRCAGCGPCCLAHLDLSESLCQYTELVSGGSMAFEFWTLNHQGSVPIHMIHSLIYAEKRLNS